MKLHRNRIRNKLIDKSGFTLLEMIIVIALLSVFFTMVSFIIPFWYKAYTKTVNQNYARQIASSAMGAIEEQIRFANQVQVIQDGTTQRLTGKNAFGTFYIPMKDSTNLIDGLVYDEDFFMNNDITLSFTKSPGEDFCTVTVQVLREGEKVLSKTRTVMLSGEN